MIASFGAALIGAWIAAIAAALAGTPLASLGPALIGAWLALTPSAATPAGARMPAVPRNAQTAIVQRYLTNLKNTEFDAAFGLLDSAARAYYRDARNFRSVYAADEYRIERFTLVGVRRAALGSVYFARETARYRDHAHDVELEVTASVPVGVIPEGRGWRIKDPGHPWRAFATRASSVADGVRVTVKKLSFFARRIEVVVTFANLGDAFVTLLPYGKSVLRDDAGKPYRIIETRNWSLTDRTLFEGLRLAPSSQYTGMLSFACEPLDNAPRTYALTVAPLLVDRADTPFAVDVGGIAAPGRSGARGIGE